MPRTTGVKTVKYADLVVGHYEAVCPWCRGGMNLASLFNEPVTCPWCGKEFILGDTASNAYGLCLPIPTYPGTVIPDPLPEGYVPEKGGRGGPG